MRHVGLLVLVATLCGVSTEMLCAADDAAGLENLGHVGIAVSDLQTALHFYVDQLGLKEAFRLKKPDGSPSLVYLRVSYSNSFVELFPGTKQPHSSVQPRPYHFGLFVKDLQATLHTLQSRGYALAPDAFGQAAKVQADGTLLYFIHDPDGNNIELSQITPESLQAKSERRKQE